MFRPQSTSIRKLVPTLINGNSPISRRLSSTYIEKQVQFSHDPESKIGTITLHSPIKHNPLSVEMGRQFKETIESIRSSISNHKINVNAIILQGANSSFSAGGDIQGRVLRLRKHRARCGASRCGRLGLSCHGLQRADRLE